MMVYICTKFHENILDSIKVIERKRFSYQKISKGHNSIKNVGGVTVLFLCTLSGDFMKTFRMVSKVYSEHDFHKKNFKGP